MQAIARETNLSETSFVLHDAARDGAFDVRIFTPAKELPYAGHPTLGTAFAIREALCGGAADELVLRLGVGLVRVRFARRRAGLAHGAARDASRPAPEPARSRRRSACRSRALAPDAPARGRDDRRSASCFVPLRDLAALRACRIEPGA